MADDEAVSDSETAALQGRAAPTADLQLRRFIAICYILVAAAFTTAWAFSIAATSAPAMQKFFSSHSPLFWFALAISLVIILTNMFLSSVWEVPVLGAALLVILTLSLSYCFSVFSASLSLVGVIVAGSAACGVFAIASAVALLGKTDITSALPALLVAVCGLVLGALILIARPSLLGTKIWAACGAAVFAFVVCYDTQWLVRDARLGGRGGLSAGSRLASSATRLGLCRRMPLTETSYVAGALRLLLDVVSIYALMLFVTGPR